MAKMFLKGFFSWVMAVALALSLIGCGGSGAFHSPEDSQGNLNLFATDTFADDYSAVWVRIYQINLIDSQGKNVTVFSSVNGQEINLSSLSDGKPLYKLLGNVQVPVGTYSLANVTLDQSLKLIPTGSTQAQPASFDTGFTSGFNRSRIPVRFAEPLLIPQVTNFTLDFDLSQWVITNGVVIPVVVTGTNVGILDPNRHVSGIFKGFISCLVGPRGSRHFLLTFGDGRSIRAVTDSSTIIYHEDGTGEPFLVNQQLVEITGTYDPRTGTLSSEVIEIDDYSSLQEVHGSVEELEDIGGRIKVRFVSKLFPNDVSIFVKFTNQTKAYLGGGREVSIDDLVDYFNGVGNSEGSSAVKVAGLYDEGTRTLVATWIRSADSTGYLQISLASADEKDLRVSGVVLGWSGFETNANLGVVGQFDANTQYFRNGNPISSTAFFQQIKPGVPLSLVTKSIDSKGWYSVTRVTGNW
ncbi:MAG: DUF4382 domain-containing protein [Fimbriimonadaceae bacterium]|nr:DUF4382 domain-containing protein [Fimbriimonadaceae bacterium]